MKVDILLIPETRITSPRVFNSRWPDADLAKAQEIAAGFPAAVTDVTSGMCQIQQTVKVVGPLTSVSAFGGSWWPARNDTTQWVSADAQAVIVLWESDEDIEGNPAGLTTYGGLGMGGKPMYATWALPDGAESWWVSKTFPQGAMIHEFGHGLESNAKALGFTITSLHHAEQFGYTSADNWLEWYRAWFSGKIPYSLNAEVWAALGEGVAPPPVEPVPVPTKPTKKPKPPRGGR